MFRTDCRKPHATLSLVFFPAFQGFSHCSNRPPRAAEFAAPAGPARLFVLSAGSCFSKNSAKSQAAATGPSLASGSSRKTFFADRQRKTCVRASATSRTNSPANIAASQAKADANKVDAASPFALLVERATAKDGAKPAKK